MDRKVVAVDYEFAKEKNPLLDYSGNNWDIMATFIRLFYLVGNFAKEDNVFPSRNVRMSAGREHSFSSIELHSELVRISRTQRP